MRPVGHDGDRLATTSTSAVIGHAHRHTSADDRARALGGGLYAQVPWRSARGRGHADRRRRHEADDPEVAPAARAPTRADRAPRRRLPRGAGVGAGRLRQDGDARVVGGRARATGWPGCRAIRRTPSRRGSCRACCRRSRRRGRASPTTRSCCSSGTGANTYDSAVAVANELATVDAPGVIVVDDLHLAAPAPAMLAAFIDALPDGFRFVAGTRSDPPLSLARLRLRGELLELRGDDLRFGAAEMSDFFAPPRRRRWPATSCVRLHELTEGWPAGAQLAAIALQRGVGRRRLPGGLRQHGSGRRRLPASARCWPACRPSSSTSSSRRRCSTPSMPSCARPSPASRTPACVLERLLAANLFVVPLDDRARWYRYHHLFGAFLRARLASLGSSRLAGGPRSGVPGARGARRRRRRAAARHGDGRRRAGRADPAGRDRPFDEHVGGRRRHRSGRCACGCTSSGATFIETDPAWVVEFLIGLITLTGADDAPSWLERVRRAHPDADGELDRPHRGGVERAPPAPRAAAGGAPPPASWRWTPSAARPPNRGLLPLAPRRARRAPTSRPASSTQAGAVLERALAHPVGSPVADDVRHPGIAAFVAAVAGELSRADELAARSRRGRPTSSASAATSPGGSSPAWRWSSCTSSATSTNRRGAAPRRGQARPREASHRLTLQSLVTLQHAKLARVLGDEAGADALLAQARLLLRRARRGRPPGARRGGASRRRCGSTRRRRRR